MIIVNESLPPGMDSELMKSHPEHRRARISAAIREIKDAVRRCREDCGLDFTEAMELLYLGVRRELLAELKNRDQDLKGTK